ncbi:MAG TPA: 2-dehydro-3-deoxy-6-phosphogalactonate aldolase [Steroidobacteraceae bacterium]|nr:2-dehydro-3-deoxy-6-phosphogalactonate aldolase [Steroidobacteraceae bacterium]
MKPDAPAHGRTLVAILRGVTPTTVMAVADTLYAAGFRCIEVPLNSPDPFASIAALAARKPGDCLVGAGTVLSVDDVERARAVGARLIVAPNCNPEVIRCALRLGLAVIPGVATATEAFAAIEAGASELKLFPAVSLGPAHLRALKSVLPEGVRVYPVGGIGVADVQHWIAAGADGFGFGSEIYRPGYTLADIDARARRLLQALAEA